MTESRFGMVSFFDYHIFVLNCSCTCCRNLLPVRYFLQTLLHLKKRKEKKLNEIILASEKISLFINFLQKIPLNNNKKIIKKRPDVPVGYNDMERCL